MAATAIAPFFDVLLVPLYRLLKPTALMSTHLVCMVSCPLLFPTLAATTITPFLDVLLVPLYRLSEAGAASAPAPEGEPNPNSMAAAATAAKALGEEVMGHLKGVVGAEAVLAAYSVARDAVRGARTERRRKAAMQVSGGGCERVRG